MRGVLLMNYANSTGHMQNQSRERERERDSYARWKVSLLVHWNFNLCYITKLLFRSVSVSYLIYRLKENKVYYKLIKLHISLRRKQIFIMFDHLSDSQVMCCDSSSFLGTPLMALGHIFRCIRFLPR